MLGAGAGAGELSQIALTQVKQSRSIMWTLLRKSARLILIQCVSLGLFELLVEMCVLYK